MASTALLSTMLLLRQKLTTKLVSWSKSAHGKRTLRNLHELLQDALTLIAFGLLAALLMACSTPQMPPSKPAANPSLPAPHTSQPSEPYLTRAKRNMEEWRKKLLATQPTP